jgi:cell fate (sporulation/competence/biofilm development) regulator YmcA (YheA/YmcA/DUF963 family)
VTSNGLFFILDSGCVCAADVKGLHGKQQKEERIVVDHNELLGQAFELGNLIAESPEVEEYKRTKENMESNREISSLLTKLREMQEEYDKLQTYSQGDHLKGLEQSISELLDQLDEFPEVVSFKQASAKVDELLKSVTTLLANCVSGKVNGVPFPNPAPRKGG